MPNQFERDADTLFDRMPVDNILRTDHVPIEQLLKEYGLGFMNARRKTCSFCDQPVRGWRYNPDTNKYFLLDRTGKIHSCRGKRK
jgi:hypothetical protein